MEKELKKELKKRNKNRFIEFATKEIAKFQFGTVNIPAFIEAEQAYKDFQNAGLFDSYGYLK